MAAKHGYKGIARFLIETGQVNMDAMDSNGRTPLFLAAQRGYEGIVKLLVETRQVNINARDNNGWTPFFLAAVRGHKGIAKLLTETGQVNADAIHWRTSLSGSSKKGHQQIVKVIKTHRCDGCERPDFAVIGSRAGPRR